MTFSVLFQPIILFEVERLQKVKLSLPFVTECHNEGKKTATCFLIVTGETQYCVRELFNVRCRFVLFPWETINFVIQMIIQAFLNLRKGISWA